MRTIVRQLDPSYQSDRDCADKIINAFFPSSSDDSTWRIAVVVEAQGNDSELRVARALREVGKITGIVTTRIG